jgi:AraC-like DNA-binding protein
MRGLPLSAVLKDVTLQRKTSGIGMLSSAVYTFTDPDEYTTAFRGSQAQLTIHDAGATMAGRDLTPPPNTLTFRPSPQALARLRQLHSGAGTLAERAPEIITNPQAARGLEQALIGAVVGCLADHPQDKSSHAQRRHAAVMRRFWQVVEQSAGQPLYIPEICSAIQVSERTLLACCHEHLGVGPKRYLLLRRMALARKSLREQAAGTTSVTDIAMRYGFWNLGRFAVEYKVLFGESPSFTLRGPDAAARPLRSDIRLSASN